MSQRVLKNQNISKKEQTPKNTKKNNKNQRTPKNSKKKLQKISKKTTPKNQTQKPNSNKKKNIKKNRSKIRSKIKTTPTILKKHKPSSTRKVKGYNQLIKSYDRLNVQKETLTNELNELHCTHLKESNKSNERYSILKSELVANQKKLNRLENQNTELTKELTITQKNTEHERKKLLEEKENEFLKISKIHQQVIENHHQKIFQQEKKIKELSLFLQNKGIDPISFQHFEKIINASQEHTNFSRDVLNFDKIENVKQNLDSIYLTLTQILK
ncbi:survival motor neuron-like protein [Anaeramoeba flamelloides]|uniref:Survival motor neuron-like protein n=1 Tax=Anaeramoeba flamelloides TaxID=1746091 RepID=A0ABQ8Y8J8_9EUKA|nr:survival motor neuron-like protein [Anaeramoeba flamelloides]